MTFDEFKTDFFVFLESSTVNLGRKTAKTRKEFISQARAKFKTFSGAPLECGPAVKKEQITNPVNDRILCIKPTGDNRALSVGKGAHAMTSAESMRADEELGRSPFGNTSGKKE